MSAIDMILHEPHGNRLSVLGLDHLGLADVSLTIIPGNSNYLSIYGASFDLGIEAQVALIKALLINLDRAAPAQAGEMIDELLGRVQAA